ncbi:hypothetical protein AAF712_006216 [Marasmius tenuissimus]|uniref:LYC1 C-terminal domain-containing protein n=1 Tax=Marasmius tenuissimus TaxID=585030 RepID=A0ABR2ZZW5_9AGAR
MDLSSLSLFVATEEQAKESLRRARHQWGKDMTPEEFEMRDQTWTRELECAKDGKFTTCLKWPAIIARKDQAPAMPQPGSCYAIGSVFTPTRHRGHGYAAHMMRLLHWVLAPESFLENFEFPEEWGNRPEERRGDANVSVLSSDIGPEFYLKVWDCIGANDRELVQCARVGVSLVKELGLDEPGSDVTWEWLDEKGVKEYCDGADEEMMKEDLAAFATSQVETDKDISFAILSGCGVEAFNRGRLRHAYQDYHISRWGVKIKDKSSTSTATWIVELPRQGMTSAITTPKLLFSRLRVDNPTHFPLILKLASDAARTVDVAMIEAWNVPQHLKNLAAQCGGVEKEREAKLSSFKWYGEEEP